VFLLLRHLARQRREIALPRGPRGSLHLRHVDAGSCNGCEHELQATAGPFHDMQRFGLFITASPRHADVLLITGPVTNRMRHALEVAYASMPEPRLVAALGDCALGCSLLGDPREYLNGVGDVLPVDIRIPGCPPDPETIAHHLVAAMERPGHARPRGVPATGGDAAPG
jgi:Ni,Fe-hydrogenase III small subunit